MEIRTILARLQGVTKTANGWQAQCPAHEDRTASLCIALGSDQRILFHCQAGCEPERVCTALGLKLKDLFQAGSKLARPKIAATYDYHDSAGMLVFQVVRYNPKGFRQRRPDGKGGWIWSMNGVKRVLYRLPEITRDIQGGLPVFITEGEKDVLAMVERGFTATTNAGGAGKWLDSYTETLRGADVVIIADKDKPGQEHAQLVASQLYRIAKSVRVIELLDVNGKPVKDSFDFFAAGGTREAVIALVDSTAVWRPTKEKKAESAPVDLKAEWLAHFDKATCPSSGLAQFAIPAREPILGQWFKQGDLGFIFGARGLGKTWLAMHIARQCAEGGSVADWKAQKARRVLYVDGEMPLDGIGARDAALTTAPADGMFYLQHEALFHLTGMVLNLTNPSVQAALLERCLREKTEILILDNLSCLFTGIKENDADAWEQVLPWLLDLRRHRIAVIFIAHAGRNGFMRGTSRREDAAFWIIQLTEAKDAGEIQNGAKFVARFVKNRNATEADCPPLEWHFSLPQGETRARVGWKKMSTAQIFRQWIEDGVISATEIAEEMGISKGQVSKLAKRAMVEGWLKKIGRDYALTGQA